MNYNVSSFLAVAFAFFAFNASATTNEFTSADLNCSTVQMELLDDVADGAITLDAVVQLPNGSTLRKTQTYRNMIQAVAGYVSFVIGQPFGTGLVRVEFTDSRGQVVFAAQG